MKIGKVTGVSIGSAIAALHLNGYSPEEIEEIFLTELMGIDPAELKRTLHLPSILRFIRHGLMNLEELFANIVTKYNLEPKGSLRILAYNVVKAKPVVFAGTDYNLATALAASCAIPGVMRPVWYGQNGALGKLRALVRSWRSKAPDDGLLIDGGMHHPAPGNYCNGMAIISKLGFASRLPDDRLPLVDLAFHLLELSSSAILDWYYADSKNHLVIETGVPDVAILSFGLSRQKCQQMIDFGYVQTIAALDAAIAKGLIPIETTEL